MADPIKKRIMDQVLSNLQPLLLDFRSITREIDIEKASKALPALMVYDSDEDEVGKDHRGRTFRFSIAVKLLFQSRRDIQAATDVMVAKVQALMEGDIQLGGLANIVDGQSVIKYQNGLDNPVFGAFLTYNIEYRRRLGDPYTTY